MPAPTISTIRHLNGVGILADCSPASFPHHFKRHNLVYGFNGSGKTTLSRLIDSISERGVSPKLGAEAQFEFELSDGSRPTANAPDSAASRFIAVFNEDYVERSLAWSEGTAEAIIYIGEQQAELARRLEKLEREEREQANTETLAGSEFSSSERELANLARDIARQIAEELGIGRNYNAGHLKADYSSASYGPDDKQPEEIRTTLRQTINQTRLPEKLILSIQRISPVSLVEKSRTCLETSLAQLTVESLERRRDALQWVRDGLDLHETESECLFCASSIPDGRLQALRAALGEGFEALKTSIREAQAEAREFSNRCRSARDALANLGEPLPSRATDIGAKRSSTSALLGQGERAGAEIVASLEQKLSNPEISVPMPEFDSNAWTESLTTAIAELESAVEANNQEIENFSTEQENARTKLKHHHLADYESAYRDAVSRVSDNKNTYEAASTKLRETRQQIDETREHLRTHGPAAATMNEILRGYLGHDEIQLIANDEGYQLSRSGSLDPKPLSEGEKTAVAFCHFLATLHSEGRKPQDFVVVLDDPISSLDARAMTHAVSLIQQRFDEPLQLFVLTHNLDFMREIKKWLHRRYEGDLAEFLFIETAVVNGSRVSTIVKMPKLIREYDSEYHYLYSLAKKLAENPSDFAMFAYLMPNALRKVLDIFLAFKIPGGMGLSPKVDKLIRDHASLDSARVKAMERLAQLESHSESIGDTTTFSAYTLEQISDAAKCLMEVIEAVDPGHKQAMDKLC